MTQFFKLPLSNGGYAKIPFSTENIFVVGGDKPDKVGDYGHLTLELGMLYQYFGALTHTPDRDRFLGLMKMFMVVLKANNNQAKYPLEILNFLLQQYCILPKQEACLVLQLCFVNTNGKANAHRPADVIMENNIKTYKKHIKHMYSNKTTSNIEKRSAAIGGIQRIGANFDEQTGVVTRSSKHSTKPVDGDEMLMMDDLRKLRPFSKKPGRSHTHFQNIVPSMVKLFDSEKFCAWVHKHKNNVQY